MLKTVVGLSILGLLFGPASVLLGLAAILNPASEASCLPTTVAGLTHVQAADGNDASSVEARLRQIRFGPGSPTMTAGQARNAVTIAQVARELRVPRFGLEVAIATAIQESSLVNLHGGHADSQGLFQQRPSAGWGTAAQVTNPRLAALAFFGRAPHTSNPGLLDLPGWEQMDLAAAAQAVQVSAHPGAYAEWEGVAREISDVLGGDLPVSFGSDQDCLAADDPDAAYTVGTLNLLGAGHTDERPGGRHTAEGFAAWSRRLPRALQALRDRGATVVGLQEVHRPQARALATTYSGQWGMWPTRGSAQNRVIWNPATWRLTDARTVDIPYFGGHEVGMPLVQLTSRATGQVIWIWSVHNPASTRGNARAHRIEALRRQLATVESLRDSGLPVLIVGDFNDRRDGAESAHCTLTPVLSNAFGAGGRSPCTPPPGDAPIDHIFGANVQFASATVDRSTQTRGISDHPLVVASIRGSIVGFPVPANLSGTDQRNWHSTGTSWSSWHTGTDFSVPCGTPVLAAHGGVVRIESGPDWYGTWLVKIETGPASLSTWYAHLQSVDVEDGQSVTAGQQLGSVGALGNSTGCHLHFEVHLRNGSIYGPDNTNPSTWLAQRLGQGAR